MRSRQVTCGFGRDYPGKYEDSPYPQWMKTLEEKYQKLHQKVVFNSGQYLSRRASLLSRVNAAPKLAWQAGSTRKSIFSTESARRSESRLGQRQEKCDVSTRDEKAPVRERQSPLVIANDDVKNDVIVDDVNDEDEDDLDEDQNGNTEVMISEREGTCEIIIQEPDGHSLTIVHNAGNNAVDVMEGPRLRKASKARNVKTCVSRTSHKTSKSCPAVIERSLPRPGDQGARPKQRERKPFKVYTGMSQEARHVINETLKERGVDLVAMNKIGEFLKGDNPRTITITKADHAQSGSREGKFSHAANGVHRNSSTLQNGEHLFRRDSSRSVTRKASGVEVSALFDKRIRFRAERRDDAPPPSGPRPKSCNVMEQVEVLSVSGKSSEKSCRCDPQHRKPPKHPSAGVSRFPSIESDSHAKVMTLQQLQNMNYRVPGVGRYDIPFQREETFEITFPDFDIRYREILPAERPLSETPPPEIKNRAIAKCQEWLSKYTPR